MEQFNPWWFKEEDPVYTAWKDSNPKWIPKEINELSLEPFSLNFLVGPRQVGKTTLLKILIHNIAEKMNEKSIFYYSCDELTDYRELSNVLDSYLKSKDAWGIKNSYVFLDEITFVDEWWRALKAKIDSGKMLHNVVTITGSASIELIKGKETFPGRRGHGKDVIMRPLSFASYVEAVSVIRPKKAKEIDKITEAMESNKVFQGMLSNFFLDYLDAGGFPAPVKEKVVKGKVSEQIKKAILDWLRVDWGKIGRSDNYMKETLSFLLGSHCTPISWLSIAKNTSMGSPNTAQAYIETLENLLVANVLFLLEPDGKIVYRKNKKVHFTDPLYYKIFSEYTNTEYHQPCQVEGIVASHLARVAPVYYWRNSSEVDVVTLVNGLPVGLEVKWSYHLARKPRHLSKYIETNKDSIPLFLASFDC
jgi:predicted AAA+ superfamily ATPase